MFDPDITTNIQFFLMELSSVPLGNLIGAIRPVTDTVTSG
jgi:hypothetical protein